MKSTQAPILTLNWLPLGGFVRLMGEDNPALPGGFAAAKAWQRLLVLLGGVTMNLATAVLAYSILFSQVGVPQFSEITIKGLEPGAPAEQAGIQVGDVVLYANGERIKSTSQLIGLIHQNLGKPVELIVQRQGATQTITVTPRTIWPENSGPMGVVLGIPYSKPSSWFATLPTSIWAVGRDINMLLSLPGRLLAGTARPQEAQVAGPRSLWNLFQAAVASDVQSRQDGDSQTSPTYYTLGVIIGLSISLAVFNLLPIPALDGGRIFFLLPELLFQRPIPAQYQMAANGIGFIFLISLLLFFYIKDFINPISIVLP
ncbi:MAG: M50 family metallopeptidase [Anaerolineales bacterium]|nr:M50 family metallopeptidase [Anaerolineales bacterium]